MPVVGLPTTLEVTLGALLQQHCITSWKVCGEGEQTTVVLRLKAGSSDGNMAGQQTPVYFRRKPPSQTNRDRRRTEERRQAEERRWAEERRRAEERRQTEERQEDKASALFPFETSPSLFMPTPPITQSVSHTNTPASPNHMPSQSVLPTHDYRCASGAVTVLEADTVAEQQGGIDLVEVPVPDITMEGEDCDEYLDQIRDAGYSGDTIKNYVGGLRNRSLQRNLRDVSRNKDFLNVYTSDEIPDTIICESEDMIFQFIWTDDTHNPADYFWFAKKNTRQLTQEEKDIYSKLQLWTPADRDRIKDRISAGLDVLHVMMDAIRFFLG